MNEGRIVLYNVKPNSSGSYDWTWVILNTYGHARQIRDRILEQIPPIGGATEATSEKSDGGKYKNPLYAFSLSYESRVGEGVLRRHEIHRRKDSVIKRRDLGSVVDHRKLRGMFPSHFPKRE